MKRAAGFLAALVLVWGMAVPCWGVELTLTSHAALLMEKPQGRSSMPRMSMRRGRRPASPRS